MKSSVVLILMMITLINIKGSKQSQVQEIVIEEEEDPADASPPETPDTYVGLRHKHIAYIFHPVSANECHAKCDREFGAVVVNQH